MRCVRGLTVPLPAHDGIVCVCFRKAIAKSNFSHTTFLHPQHAEFPGYKKPDIKSTVDWTVSARNDECALRKAYVRSTLSRRCFQRCL